MVDVYPFTPCLIIFQTAQNRSFLAVAALNKGLKWAQRTADATGHPPSAAPPPTRGRCTCCPGAGPQPNSPAHRSVRASMPGPGPGAGTGTGRRRGRGRGRDERDFEGTLNNCYPRQHIMAARPRPSHAAPTPRRRLARPHRGREWGQRRGLGTETGTGTTKRRDAVINA